jgi:hypothetical protein
MAKKLQWTASRCRELEQLHTLLVDAATMNHGSNVVQRIERCERIATRLNSSNLNTGRDSLFQFLVHLAGTERAATRKPKKGE